MGRPASRSGANVALAVVAGVALCALVVIGSAAQPLRAPRHDGLSTTAAIEDVLVVVGLVAAVVGLIVFVAGLLTLRTTGLPALPPRRKRLLAPILLAILLALTLGAAIRRQQQSSAPTNELAPPSTAPERPPESSPLWRNTGWGLIALLGITALGAAIVLHRRRDDVDVVPALADDDAATTVAEAVDRALDELDRSDHPREAIIAAYAHMLGALEAGGFARAPSETPRLHLARCLRAASVRAAPAEQLVRLFEEARFSTHTMTWRERDDARRALEAVRHDLDLATVR